MRFALGCVAVLTVTLAASFLSLARADEKVALDKLPAVVKDAVQKRFPNAKLVSAEKETEDGKTVYDIAIKDGEQKMSVDVSPEGKIVGYEKAIKAKDLPKAVADAFHAKYPNATTRGVEEVYKVDGSDEKLEGYEIGFTTADNKKMEVVISPEGKITKTEGGEEKK
jgi:uncharacterized membrane protein YkoI